MDKDQKRREMQRIMAAEAAFLRKHAQKRIGAVQRGVQKHVPETLEGTLQAAFCKAFGVLLRRGTTLIEKTSRPEQLRAAAAQRQKEADAHLGSTQSLRRAAGHSRDVNTAVSGAGGIGMGLLGMGLPDIPVLLGILLRSMYETAMHYGFAYDTPEEQHFLLQVMENAFLHGEALREADAALNRQIFRGERAAISLDAQIRRTSDALAAELLHLKFLQGIPVVGVVGGVSDIFCQRRLAEYAELKYRRRYVLTRGEASSK